MTERHVPVQQDEPDDPYIADVCTRCNGTGLIGYSQTNLCSCRSVPVQQDEPEAQEPCACCDGLGWETVVCLECGAVPVQQEQELTAFEEAVLASEADRPAVPSVGLRDRLAEAIYNVNPTRANYNGGDYFSLGWLALPAALREGFLEQAEAALSVLHEAGTQDDEQDADVMAQIATMIPVREVVSEWRAWSPQSASRTKYRDRADAEADAQELLRNEYRDVVVQRRRIGPWLPVTPAPAEAGTQEDEGNE